MTKFADMDLMSFSYFEIRLQSLHGMPTVRPMTNDADMLHVIVQSNYDESKRMVSLVFYSDPARIPEHVEDLRNALSIWPETLPIHR